MLLMEFLPSQGQQEQGNPQSSMQYALLSTDRLPGWQQYQIPPTKSCRVKLANALPRLYLKQAGEVSELTGASAELISAGEPAKLRMTADRKVIHADGQDLCYITVEVTDQNGTRNPVSENLLSFNIEGPGKILAVANANPVSTESYQSGIRKAWHGRCLVIVGSTAGKGKITV